MRAAPAASTRPATHVVVLVGVHEQARARVAGLAGVVVDRLVGALDRHVEVGVGQDDVGRLAAQLERDPLERAAGLGADLAPDGGRAGERDLVDVLVVDQRRAGLAVAGDHVEHALGQPRLERQLAQPQARQRRLLGGLEHDRAARRQRRGDLPGRHQQREVPRDDLPAHADRLLARVAVHVRLGDRQHVAGDLGRPAGEVAQVLDRERHVHAPGELDRLAVVERLQLGELVGVVLEGLGEGQHRARALGRGDAVPAPVLERLAGGAHGAVHVRGAGVGHLGDRPAGGRVERLEGAPVGGLEALAADDQAVRPGRERAGGVGEGVRQG